MSSETNLYRTENYQNYVNSFHRQSNVAKSISDAANKTAFIDDDVDSINSIAESLNNYLDVKVGALGYLRNHFVNYIYFLVMLFRAIINKFELI